MPLNTIPAETESYITLKNVNETLPTGMPPHKSVLAEGTLIIIQRKLDNEADNSNKIHQVSNTTVIYNITTKTRQRNRRQ